VVLLRQDPPFDMSYITTTHLLERIHPETLVVNDPASVRNAPEKVFVLDFLDLMPPTLVTRNLEDVKAFRAEHKDIILKPLYGNGGSSVFRVAQGDTNLNSLVELFQTVFREPFMVQQYRPEVRAGDKRIILVDGEYAGAVNRVPAADETRSNLHVGGVARQTVLTEREREICARLGPELKRRGLIFTGIDVIGDYLTEINVTSPTGIRQVKAFGGADIAALIWDAIESKAKR
jgi:glutathione synthase